MKQRITFLAATTVTGLILGCSAASSNPWQGFGGGGSGAGDLGFGGGGGSTPSGGNSGQGGSGGGGCPPLSGPLFCADGFVIASKPPPPLSGGTLLALASGNVFVADPDRDSVSIVDPSGAGHVLSTITLAPGAEPGRSVEDGVGHVYVSLRNAGSVAVIDPTAGALLRQIPICPSPRGLAYDPVANAVHVACEGGELVTFSAATGAVTRTIRPSTDLRDVVISGTGLLVSRFRAADVLELDASGALVKDHTFPVSALIDETDPLTRFVPDVAWRMIAVPGGSAVVHQRASEAEIPISACRPPVPYYGGGDVDGTIVANLTGIVQTTVSVVKTGAAGPDPSEVTAAASIVGAPLPIDIARAPDGAFAIAVAGSTGVSVLTMPETNVEAFVGASQRALTPALTGVRAVAVAFTAKGVLLVQSLEPPSLTIIESGRRTTTIALPGPLHTDSAQAMFHTAPKDTVACASCHPEGREDGRVWTFLSLGKKTELRRTQLVRLGGLQQTAPFHWDGAFPNIAALIEDVWVNRMGGAPVCANQENAIIAWLDKLPTPAIASGAAPDSVQRGSVLFHDPAVGCATCHSGPRYTNNKTVFVGTGDDRPDFQVPSLIGVGSRAPYMHNGCAPTLRDRFTDRACGGGDLHGHTSALTDAQLDDLIAFLQSL